MVETFKRWYEEDAVVSACVQKIENLHESLKRQTANYLMEEIINKPPYSEMVADDIFKLATAESQRRRWYDYDEVIRLFVELLRHAPAPTRREIALKSISFIEDLGEQQDIDIDIPEL